MQKNTARKHNAIFPIALAVGVGVADQLLKHASENHRLPGQRKDSDGRMFFSNLHNTGAALNVGQRKPQLVMAASAALLLSTTIAFFQSLGKKGQPMLRTALALLLGGGYSNLYDRWKRGHVVDYVSVKLPERISIHRKQLQDGYGRERIRYLVYNVADISIAIGTVLMSIAMNRSSERQDTEKSGN